MTRSIKKWIYQIIATVPLVAGFSAACVWGLFWLNGQTYTSIFERGAYRDVYYIATVSLSMLIYVGLTLAKTWKRKV